MAEVPSLAPLLAADLGTPLPAAAAEPAPAPWPRRPPLADPDAAADEPPDSLVTAPEPPPQLGLF